VSPRYTSRAAPQERPWVYDLRTADRYTEKGYRLRNASGVAKSRRERATLSLGDQRLARGTNRREALQQLAGSGIRRCDRP
jgi:hypothetical protein